jgi:CubicO group peptidase (beta-lactamase class C family)
MNRKEIERVSPESVGIPSPAIAKLLDALESGFTEMHGLMIMRHDKVCAEGWWAPYGPGVRHGDQSLTKTYAATAVGLAVTEGLVRLEDRVIDIFPEEAPANPSQNLKKLRVRDVLCMGCGMDTMPRPSKDWIREFLAMPVNHEPGTAFMYNSTGSTLLGAIVRKLTGLGLHDWLKPRLFDKIGIDADNLRWFTMPDGMEIGGGGLFSTTEDNLRLMKLYSQGGVWEGERILSKEYVRLATSKQNDSATEEKVNPPAKDNFLGYGFQMWMCRPRGAYRADGAMGQFSIVLPEQDMIVSINETASGAIWAQKTLDTVYGVLLPQVKPGALPPDEAAAGGLKRRLDSLALPRPAYAPFGKPAGEISGMTYRVTGGDFCLRQRSFMAPSADECAIADFRFDFAAADCKLTVTEAGRKLTLDVGIDGVRKRNVLSPIQSPITELYLSGAWTAGNVFELTARWVETCFETVYAFEFDGGNAAVCPRVALGFAPMPGKEKDDGIQAKRM